MRRGRQVAEVLRVLLVATLVEVALHTTRLPRLARWCGVDLDLTSAPPADAPPVALPARVRRSMAAVDLVLPLWPFGDTCLRRCLVLGQRLRTLHPVLRIGVALDEGDFRAHSWLVVSGQVLDGDVRRFAPFGAAR
jgi:hypothetical protein